MNLILSSCVREFWYSTPKEYTMILLQILSSSVKAVGAHFCTRFSVVVMVQFVLNDNFLYTECSEETGNRKKDGN